MLTLSLILPSTVLSTPAEQEAGSGTAVAIMRWKDIAPDKITIRLKFLLD